MMPEKKRAPHQSGRGKGNVSQIQGHLCDKTADELLTELEARMDEMTDLTYDEDVIDSYLAALDKKAPLEKDFDVERSWEKFRSQHAILFDEDISPKPEVPQRGSHGFRFRRAFARVVVVAAIVAVLCAGRWHRRVWCNRAMDGGDIPLCCPGRPCNFRGFRSSR